MCSCRLGFTRTCVGVLVGFSLAGAVFADGSRPGEDRQGWRQLNLSEVTRAGTKVYYEKALEPNLPVFERALTKFLAERARLTQALTKRHEIVADINRILGMPDVDAGEQREVLAKIGGIFEMKLTFYLVRGATARDFVRGGGRLPNCSYDPKTDVVAYQPRLDFSDTRRAPENWDFCMPIPTGEPFDKFVPFTFTMLERLVGSWVLDTGMYGLTGATLIKRVRPADPYWRWFSEGFALAIAQTLVEKYVDKEAAQDFAGHYSPAEYKDVERDINLRYWMLPACCPYANDVPVRSENRIREARYAYSVLEAKRLIDTRGMDCIRAILDKIAARESRKGSDLLEVIKEVTGEDMEERLRRYQTFQTQAEGLSKYANAYQAAFGTRNLEQMFVYGLRVMELRGDPSSPGYLQCFKEAARLLVMMGHEEAGDEAMRQAIDLYSKDPTGDGHRAATEVFVMYALECNSPRKAVTAAEELLTANPRNVPALTVKMLTSLQDGNVAGAKGYAGQILTLATEQSIPYRVASHVIAIDPNRPPAYKKPDKPQ
jgi:hypothetical protein